MKLILKLNNFSPISYRFMIHNVMSVRDQTTKYHLTQFYDVARLKKIKLP